MTDEGMTDTVMTDEGMTDEGMTDDEISTRYNAAAPYEGTIGITNKEKGFFKRLGRAIRDLFICGSKEMNLLE